MQVRPGSGKWLCRWLFDQIRHAVQLLHNDRHPPVLRGMVLIERHGATRRSCGESQSFCATVFRS